jgi:hypothetical protein
MYNYPTSLDDSYKIIGWIRALIERGTCLVLLYNNMGVPIDIYGT